MLRTRIRFLILFLCGTGAGIEIFENKNLELGANWRLIANSNRFPRTGSDNQNQFCFWIIEPKTRFLVSITYGTKTTLI
jgi:hypothetical protein